MDSDEQIIKSYLAGSSGLFEVLVNRYVDKIYNFVVRQVKDKGRAEDITQETFIRAWKHIKSFNPEKKFSVWLFSIARNLVIDNSRKKRMMNFSEFETDDEGADFDPIDLGLMPENEFEKKNASEAVKRMLEALPPHYRSVLVLYYQEQFNFREISEITGDPENTVRGRHRRALALVKKLIMSGDAPEIAPDS